MPKIIENSALIFANGTPLSPALRNLLRKGRFIVALDGAIEAMKNQSWCPDLIAGDFDSAKPATLRFFEKKGVPIFHTPDQNYTDLEKAIAWCVLRDFRSIWIAQGLGSRIDHTFSALSILKRFHSSHHELLLIQDKEKIRFSHTEKLRLRGKAGRRIAVLPFPSCRVRSKGLTYEMKNLELQIGVRESVSNAAKKPQVDLEIEGDALVVEEFL
jgi:thiamine pyrophosphokinase